MPMETALSLFPFWMKIVLFTQDICLFPTITMQLMRRKTVSGLIMQHLQLVISKKFWLIPCRVLGMKLYSIMIGIGTKMRKLKTLKWMNTANNCLKNLLPVLILAMPPQRMRTGIMLTMMGIVGIPIAWRWKVLMKLMWFAHTWRSSMVSTIMPSSR